MSANKTNIKKSNAKKKIKQDSNYLDSDIKISSEICAPIDGVVSTIFSSGHAFGVTGFDGTSVLINTIVTGINLRMVIKVKKGDRVKKGDLMCEVIDLDILSKKEAAEKAVETQEIESKKEQEARAAALKAEEAKTLSDKAVEEARLKAKKAEEEAKKAEEAKLLAEKEIDEAKKIAEVQKLEKIEKIAAKKAVAKEAARIKKETIRLLAEEKSAKAKTLAAGKAVAKKAAKVKKSANKAAKEAKKEVARAAKEAERAAKEANKIASAKDQADKTFIESAKIAEEANKIAISKTMEVDRKIAGKKLPLKKLTPSTQKKDRQEVTLKRKHPQKIVNSVVNKGMIEEEILEELRKLNKNKEKLNKKRKI